MAANTAMKVAVSDVVYQPSESQLGFVGNQVEIEMTSENCDETMKQALALEQWVPTTGPVGPPIRELLGKTKKFAWKTSNGLQAYVSRLDTMCEQLAKTLPQVAYLLGQIEQHKGSKFVLKANTKQLELHSTHLEQAQASNKSCIQQLREIAGMGTDGNALLNIHAQELQDLLHNILSDPNVKGAKVDEDLVIRLDAAASKKAAAELATFEAAIALGEADAKYASAAYRMETLGEVVQLEKNQVEDDRAFMNKCKAVRQKAMEEFQSATNEHTKVTEKKRCSKKTTVHTETNEDKARHSSEKAKQIWKEATQDFEDRASKQAALEEQYIQAKAEMKRAATEFSEIERRAKECFDAFTTAKSEEDKLLQDLKAKEQLYGGMSVSAIVLFKENVEKFQARLGGKQGVGGGTHMNVFQYSITNLSNLDRALEILQGVIASVLEIGIADFKRDDLAILHGSMHSVKRLTMRTEKMAEAYHNLADPTKDALGVAGAAGGSAPMMVDSASTPQPITTGTAGYSPSTNEVFSTPMSTPAATPPAPRDLESDLKSKAFDDIMGDW